MKEICLSLLMSMVSLPLLAAGWERTKNITDDIIYADEDRTFYCGCHYRSHEDSDGSGDITDTTICHYRGPQTYASRAGRVEWEHIVPA